MAKEQTEEELNIRRKARRRLVGAVALTLAVVVILPMVLDNEPKPTGNDIDLRIPSPDKVDALEPGKSVTEAPVVLPAEPPAAVTTPASTRTTDGKAASALPPPQTPAATITKPAPARTQDKTRPEDGFVAQVGAYSNANTAKQELARLKKWGFKAYTEKSGDTIRVRVGPYPDRDKAEKVAHLLEKHGLSPVVLSAK